jgi:outer membrane protein OmpA-like peptidoglycan-associated protein
VKPDIQNWKLNLLVYVSVVMLLASLTFAATPNKTRQLALGEKAKVTGSILSRDGDLVRVRDKKTGDLVIVNITDSTEIKRKKEGVLFFRHTDMDMTAMLPGLTIDVEGAGNPKGQLDAWKISFTPDAFAVEVAEEQQMLANNAAAQNAQSTADQSISAASLAQSSAEKAQNSAAQADAKAQLAGTLGLADAGAVSMLNERVSDLDDYKTASEIDVFFDRGSAVLKEAAKPALAKLADTAKSVDGYLIEISGYSSNTLSKKTDQKLSEQRAAVVARYFHEVKNIPMRRILVPVGYGTTHRLATNSNTDGRELNRRVDVKVLVNKGLSEGV